MPVDVLQAEKIMDAMWLLAKVNVIPRTYAGTPSNGTSGTFAGEAGPGCLLMDTTNKLLYQNTNTLASPTWSLVGPQAS